MRPHGSAEQLERRRLKAVRLFKEGNNLPAIARALSASVSSVSRWLQAYREKGDRGLKAKPTPGRPPKLTKIQKRRLVKVLLRVPQGTGDQDILTLDKIAQVIDLRFRVHYHSSHVWKLLASLGWSCQQPEGQALQRYEEEIEKWNQSNVHFLHRKKRRKWWGPSALSR